MSDIPFPPHSAAVTGVRLQDELNARRLRGGSGTGTDPEDRYIQQLRNVISQVAQTKMSAAESMTLKLAALSATAGIQDPQKRMSMMTYVSSAVQVRKS